MAFLKAARVSAVLAVVVALALLIPGAPAAQTREAGERAIKAAFLYNFTKFVEWPASAFAGEAAPFRVCVFVDAAFRREIDGMLAAEAVAGRPVTIVAEPQQTAGCHLAYFGLAESERATALLPVLRQAPVLTIGEGSRFLAQGGHIAFVLEQNRVRFDVNKRAVDRTGLAISSKLLRVARHVETGGGQLR